MLVYVLRVQSLYIAYVPVGIVGDAFLLFGATKPLTEARVHAVQSEQHILEIRQLLRHSEKQILRIGYGQFDCGEVENEKRDGDEEKVEIKGQIVDKHLSLVVIGLNNEIIKKGVREIK